MRTKLTNNRGDSIIEALVSLLIAVLSIAFLVASITAATKINEKNQAQVTDELSFSYVKADDTSTGSCTKDKTATIDFGEETIAFGTEMTDTADDRTESLTTNVTVDVYKTTNEYLYYEKSDTN